MAAESSIAWFVRKVVEYAFSPFSSWDSFTRALSEGITAFTDWNSKTAWPWMLVSFFIACVLYFHARRKRHVGSRTSLFAFVCPRDVYLQRSAIVDYKFVAFDLLTKPFLYSPLMAGLSLLIYKATLPIFGSLPAPQALSSADPITRGVVLAIGVAVSGDFSQFVAHYLMHKSRLLWQFHQIHHSAEVLTPITTLRVHPVENIVTGIIGAIVSATGAGIYTSISGDQVQPTTIFGVNFVLVGWYVLAYQLRHSHIWLSWGPFLSHVLISPAQHQIHHSAAEKHWDKNFGLIFAVWDWIFGSLYIPRSREELRFGIPDTDPRDFATVPRLYSLPFAKALRTFSKPRAAPPASINVT